MCRRRLRIAHPDNFLIGHPSGVTPVKVKAHDVEQSPMSNSICSGLVEPPRRLMESTAYYPSDLLGKVDDCAGLEKQTQSPDVVHEE